MNRILGCKRGSECLLKPVSNIDFNPKYGDNNGDWHWECLSNGSGSLVNGQYYFVKAISQSEIQNGSMTGTVKSLRVYTNGTIEEN